MSERLQIQRCNNSITDTLVSNQRKFLDKDRKPLVSQPPLLQAKLTINQPGDKYEQEADRISEQVMRVSDPVLQRKCAKCDDNEKKILQAKESSGQVSIDNGRFVPPIVHEVLNSPGQPLDSTTRTFMEPRFGHDFSRVRVHSGTAAEQSARDMNAIAYTVGNNIVFGKGQFIPETQEGQRLIAHELTHVVQQSREDSDRVVQRRLLVTSDSKADIKAMLGLLEQYSGFSLKHDPKTTAVSVTASVLKPPSHVMASQLYTIIEDTKQDAEIHLGRKVEGVFVGKFPTDLTKKNLVQEIRIDHILSLEKGAPGSGSPNSPTRLLKTMKATLEETSSLKKL